MRAPGASAQVGRVAATRRHAGIEEESVVEGPVHGLAVDEGIAVAVDAAVLAARHPVGVDDVVVGVGVEADPPPIDSAAHRSLAAVAGRWSTCKHASVAMIDGLGAALGRLGRGLKARQRQRAEPNAKRVS